MSKENISIPVEAETLSQLEHIASVMDCDSSHVIHEALDAYIDLYQWQVEEIRKAVSEADAGDFATQEEVDALTNKYKL